MPTYQIHRMKDNPRQSFRWAAHTSGAASVKPRDYEAATTVDAPSPYAAWAALQCTDQALRVGDLLEEPGGYLRICKYVGFEEARWVVAETKIFPAAEGAPADSQPDAHDSRV